MAKRVAIIGAGPAGLAALKAALDEGLDAVAFESKSNCAGLWCGRHGYVWPSLRANLSKFSCAFSDFPQADATSLFPTAGEMAAYLTDYANRFGLAPRIRFGATVREAEPSASGWRVRPSVSGRDGEDLDFDALILASGFFSRPLTPQSVAVGGNVSHAASYRGPAAFAGKRVLVVGAAFSGCDIAAEIATVASKATIVVRRPSWYLPRMIRSGSGKRIPLDLEFYSRRAAAGTPPADKAQAARTRHAYFTALVGDQGALHPRLAVPDNGQSAPVVVTDAFPKAVRDGRLHVLGADEVDLADTSARAGAGGEFDHVVLATGYGPALDHLDADVRNKLAFEPDDMLQPLLLAKTVFPRDVTELAFVGMYRGPYFGTIELQARWACAVLSGRVGPMASDELTKAIAEEEQIRLQRPRPQFPHPEYVAMCDDIAGRIGVLPDLDPSGPMHGALHDGPLLPAHYRLQGVHAAPSAAQAEIERVARYLAEATA